MQLEGNHRARRNALSMTPLIDVVFILLLFFMITTQFGQHQAMTLSVPGSGSTVAGPELSRLDIVLLQDGRVRIDQSPAFEQKALARNSRIDAALADSTPVSVQPEDDVDLQTLTGLMDSLAALGLPEVTLGAKR